MKYAAWLVIVVLASAVVYLSLGSRRTIDLLEDRIRSLETANAQMRDHYETRIAQLRAEQADRKAATPRGPASDLIGRLLTTPQAGQPYRQELMRRIVTTLGLAPAQEAGLKSVVEEFVRARRQVFERAVGDRRSVVEAPYLDMLNGARRTALDTLAALLGAEQYQAFLRHDYDRQLGLRIVSPP